MSEPFKPKRDPRWYYVHHLIEHVEQHNCALGCKRPDPNDVAEHGPGGLCDLLALATVEQPIAEWVDDGVVVHCTAREPVDE